ncbi:MAG: ABC transporter substrate-binding protein, partial [Gammaproteobacteria bacterium]|nr:ABC transporter substrate-binding protein [Gammaproteobacteria bacterium]
MKTAVFMRQLLAVVVLFALETASAAPAIDVTDDDGRHLTFREIPQRIVALAPGATEMLFAAGAGAQVKATVQYANEPAAARNVPRIGDVISVDMERLVAVHPDVVVTWPGGGNSAQAEAIEKLGIPTYHQQVNRLADLPG